MPIIIQKRAIIEEFKRNKEDKSWAFLHLKPSQTNYLTHGYHRYPAKFIPQLASRLIQDFTKRDDIVCDPFMGGGTTIVESLLNHRKSIGTDINEVAWLITKAKTTPIEPNLLDNEIKKLFSQLYFLEPSFDKNQKRLIEQELSKIEVKNGRIDYWFKKETKEELAIILDNIMKIKNEDIRTFFLCGFSNILKSCSIWLMKSIKPTRDLKKKIPPAFPIFKRQINMMKNKNKFYYSALTDKIKSDLNKYLKIELGDARKIDINDNEVSLVVTSPPYVTSYEYADIHQLTIFWLNYAKDLEEFRKKFIGTSYHAHKKINLNSSIAEETISELGKKSVKKSKEVATYFSEMNESFEEMYRYLKIGGKACIVIGNTNFKDINIPNAEVFVEQMMNLRFKVHNLIKRSIPSKILPSSRDPITGRFTSMDNPNKKLAYPTEYIIIMEKSN